MLNLKDKLEKTTLGICGIVVMLLLHISFAPIKYNERGYELKKTLQKK